MSVLKNPKVQEAVIDKGLEVMDKLVDKQLKIVDEAQEKASKFLAKEVSGEISAFSHSLSLVVQIEKTCMKEKNGRKDYAPIFGDFQNASERVERNQQAF